MPISSAGFPKTHEAVRELGSLADAAALEALADAAAVEDQFLRRIALEVIGRHPQGRELRSIILGAFGDPSEYVVRTACNIVEQWELLEAHDLAASLGECIGGHSNKRDPLSRHYLGRCRFSADV
ncbi:MAG: hypothetical protein H0V72_19350 [Bradyrhizobium sp.]|nr:hypothetical protein [Bradyrhizobium sp.]